MVERSLWRRVLGLGVTFTLVAVLVSALLALGLFWLVVEVFERTDTLGPNEG